MASTLTKPVWYYQKALEDRLRNATAYFMRQDPTMTMGALASMFLADGLTKMERSFNEGRPFETGTVPRGRRQQCEQGSGVAGSNPAGRTAN